MHTTHLRPASISHIFAALYVALVLIFAGPTQAQTTPQTSTNLDSLFNALKGAPNASQAREITEQIWQIWTQPEDPTLAALMDKSLQARRESSLDQAIELLDEIVTLYPDYAEAWNQRATLNYLRGHYEESLIDIAETLAREPRHFGALTGRCLVYLKLDDRDQALQSIVEALKIHPHLSERHLFPELINPPART